MILFGCFVFFCLVFVFVFWPSGLRTRLCALGSAGGWWGFAVPPVAFFGCWGFAWGGPCLCVCFLRAVPLLFVFFFLRAVPCFFFFFLCFFFFVFLRAVPSLPLEIAREFVVIALLAESPPPDVAPMGIVGGISNALAPRLDERKSLIKYLI